MRRYLDFVVRTSARTAIVVLAVGALAGVCSAALIALVGTLFARIEHGVPLSAVSGIVGLVIALTAFEYLAKRRLLRHSEDVAHRFRLQYADWLLARPLATTEAKGQTVAVSAFSEDIRRISLGLEYLPEVGISLAAILGGAAYLTWVSWPIMLVALCAVLPAAWVFSVIQRGVHAAMLETLSTRDATNDYFKTLVAGVKECKLDPQRRLGVRDAYLVPASRALSEASCRLTLSYTTGSLWTQSCYFAAIVTVLALVALDAAPVDVLAPFVLVALFLRSYIYRFMAALPHWSSGGAVLERLDVEGFRFEPTVDSGAVLDVPAGRLTATGPPRIVVSEVTYRYASEKDTTLFTAGPFDLVLDRPEIVFITGQNGSGKSTFLKTLCGLYSPERGSITFDGEVVSDGNRQRYQCLFSAIFTVPHVFQEVPLTLPTDPEKRLRFERYLTLLELDGKIDPDRTSQQPELSHGQIKRLALLQALVDDRPVLLFDEWAENQDPLFKAIFYRDILVRLRDEGRIIVAVTHESQYFDAADRIYALS